jgi:hypothetical protein
MFLEPSIMETAYAIFENVIELDESGIPINARHADERAAQFIRSRCDPHFEPSPPLEEWEIALY